MKRAFTLLCAVALSSVMFAQSRYDVTKKAEFTDALSQIAALPAGSTAYVYINGYVDVGTLKSGDGNPMANTLRNIHFIGVNDEEGNKATLSMEMQMPINNTEADGFSLHYENLKLRQTQGVWGNSKHLMNFKDANKHYIDTLEFINCELTELCRSIYRGEVNGAGEDYSGAGTLKVFRMENCVVHNGFRQSNAMTPIYMAQPVNEMTFKNNTFYDLTYPNGLVSFANVSDNAGRQAIKFTFENNTFCSFSRGSLLSFAGGVSSDSEFHIKNNIILQPNWADDMNGRWGDTKDVHDDMAVMDLGEVKTPDEATNGVLSADSLAARIEKGIVLTNLDGGLVQLENNLIYGYKYQNLANAIDAGDIIPIGDDENEEVEFSSLAMEEVPFAWTDFADAQNDFFQIGFSNPAYKAGKNGAPLGDTNNYTDKVIKVVTVNVTIEGSKSAKVTIAPEKAAYMAGDEITLTVNCNGSLNTFKGWSNGMTEETITIILEDNLDITATFEEIDYIAVWNLDDISSNNVVKTPPVAANHGGGLTLDYARYIIPEGEETGEYKTGAEGCAAYDGAKQAIQTRNNKVSGDIRNCFLITTPSTQFYAQAEGKADYLIINVNEALAASKLQFFVASDNVPYNKYVVSYTTDGGTTWTEAGTFDMEGKTQTGMWYPVEINLPELAQGSQIRVKGDETSGVTLTEDMQAMRDADPDMSLEDIGVTTEFLFITEIIIAPASGEQPKAKGDVNGDGAVDVADISSIITVMAVGTNDKTADVNGDGAVDVADISSVITIMAGGE